MRRVKLDKITKVTKKAIQVVTSCLKMRKMPMMETIKVITMMVFNNTISVPNRKVIGMRSKGKPGGYLLFGIGVGKLINLNPFPFEID